MRAYGSDGDVSRPRRFATTAATAAGVFQDVVDQNHGHDLNTLRREWGFIRPHAGQSDVATNAGASCQAALLVLAAC